jgi:hypothetical protein
MLGVTHDARRHENYKKQANHNVSSCSAPVLEKVLQYLMYATKYRDQIDVPDMELPPEMSLEIALAADFLDCTDSIPQSRPFLHHHSIATAAASRLFFFCFQVYIV